MDRRPQSTENRDLGVGDSLGPYRIEAVLGTGAMGIVFRAVRESDHAVVSLKIVKRELSRDKIYRTRFSHEARAASVIRNKHIVSVLDAGEVDGRQYIVADYVDGVSLAERIKNQGALPLDDVNRLASELANGIDALHGEGIVHRDIKPSNVLLDANGVSALTDFGLARGRAYTVLTKPGQVMGTLDYLAPELIKGQSADASSDIYAFGCVVFECLTGIPPFGHKSMLQVGMAHLQEKPPDPRKLREDLSPDVSWTALMPLEKDPRDRPGSATAFASMLSVASNQG